MSFRHILAATVATLVITACGDGQRDYSRWDNIPAAGWAYGDTLRLLPADTTLYGNDSIVARPLTLGIVHSGDYAYSNLWLEVTYHGRSHLYRDTVNITLSDVYGRWLGKGFGSEYQREVALSPQADIDLTREVEVRHIMRIDTLRHITRIGIAVK